MQNSRNVIHTMDYSHFGAFSNKCTKSKKSHLKSDTITYRFAFNGKEKDDEVNGKGNSIDFGARIYDVRLGRWLSLDPLQMKYPFLTPYNFCGDNPTIFIDPDGKKIVDANGKEVKVVIEITDEGTIKSISYQFAKGTSQAVQNQFATNAGVIFTELGKTATGTKQILKARDSKYKEAFELNKGKNTDDNRVKDGRASGSRLGWTSYTINTDDKGVSSVDETKVVSHIVYLGTIQESRKDPNKESSEYSDEQVIGYTAGHEIEHGTEANMKLKMQRKNNPNKPSISPEMKPEQVERDIKNEYKKQGEKK